MTERRLSGHRVELSNLDKILFPDDGITKGDLVDYYEQVADTMLPHLEDRPLTLHRYPDGIAEDGFFQQSREDHFPDWFGSVEVDHGGKTGQVDHPLADNRASVVFLADQGTITLHRWLSRKDSLDQPDILVFDLDPPGSDFEPVCRGAQLLGDAMKDMGLTPFVMTTGSSGLHVVAPLRPEADFEQVREMAKSFTRWLANEHPDDFTTEQRKAKRKGRVYLDIMRNAFGQTAVAPYAVRALQGAPVATPLEWDELDDVDLGPRSYTVSNIPKRLGSKTDPWQGMHRHAVKPATLKKNLKDVE